MDTGTCKSVLTIATRQSSYRTQVNGQRRRTLVAVGKIYIGEVRRQRMTSMNGYNAMPPLLGIGRSEKTSRDDEERMIA